MLGGVMYIVARTCPQPGCGLEISETAVLVDEAEVLPTARLWSVHSAKTWREEELQQMVWGGVGGRWEGDETLIHSYPPL